MNTSQQKRKLERKKKEPFELDEALQAWAENARDVLVDLLGLDEDEARRIGREIVIRFAEDHPGEQIYFASGRHYRMDVRDQQIYDEFNGSNYLDLAVKYRVTPRHIRRLIRRAAAIGSSNRMDDLFPGREVPDRR